MEKMSNSMEELTKKADSKGSECSSQSSGGARTYAQAIGTGQTGPQYQRRVIGINAKKAVDSVLRRVKFKVTEEEDATKMANTTSLHLIEQFNKTDKEFEVVAVNKFARGLTSRLKQKRQRRRWGRNRNR
jgi:hypothetical protein